MELQIHGYELTLRLSDAEQIEIELISERSRRHEGAKNINQSVHPGLGEERQLLALAKLLLIGPELLLLDEPTKGLDLESRRIIARALRDHAKAGGTVIMATHDLDFAEQVADDIAMMFDGEIACMEPPADFFADNVFYRA